MSEKVYCGKCRFFITKTVSYRSAEDIIYGGCSEKILLGCLKDKQGATGVPGSAEKKNENNDCPDYKKKGWWQF